jgi:hypothetical protein
MISKKIAEPNHKVDFIINNNSAKVPQSDWLNMPGFIFEPNARLRKIHLATKSLPRLVDYLEGGLGMYTGDNEKYIHKVGDPETLKRNWIPYHKKGGAKEWWSPAESLLKWDLASRKVYHFPSTSKLGRRELSLNPIERTLTEREGFLISGVTAELTARLATVGALWESNKAFVLYPKNVKQYPLSFWLAILNSSTYREIAKSLNRTVSLQIRDIERLPMLSFSKEEVKELSQLGKEAVLWSKRENNEKGKRAPSHTGIDDIVKKVLARDLLNK